MEKTKYKRILIKLSGEALANKGNNVILDEEKMKVVAQTIKEIHDEGVEVAIVVGAGNIWRGKLAEQIKIERSTADYMGMLGTIINGLAIQSSLENLGLTCRVLSSIEVKAVSEPYVRLRAIRHLEKGRIVIFAGGTGNPFFTTDTTASLRAMEIGADAIFMAKNGVEGVYDKDPRTNADAKFLPKLSYNELLIRKLEVMDQTAVTLIQNQDLVIHVFNMDNVDNFIKIIHGENIGTIIRRD